MSVEVGSMSHPVTGGTRPHMLRNKVVSRVMSKFFDETEEGMAGKSFPHCVALIILRVLKFCKVALLAAKTV